MTAVSAPKSSSGSIVISPPKAGWRSRIFALGGILIAFGVLFGGSVVRNLSVVAQVEAMPVVERTAMSRAAATGPTSGSAVAVQAAGWIEPDPYVVFATALTDGIVEKVYVLDGDPVATGDVLARMIGDDARLALRKAVVEAEAAQEEWDANIEATRQAEVAAAALRESHASLELARAELNVEQTLHEESVRVFARRAKLIAAGSIGEEEHDAAKAEQEAQEARVRVAERRIEELHAKVDKAKAEDSAARDHLARRTAEKQRRDLAQVALAEAQLRVARLEIASPIDGIVMRRLVEPGSRISTDSDNPELSRVAEIYDPAKLQVRVDVPLADLGKVRLGQAGDVVVEAIPDRRFAGRVSRITSLADIQKNTLEVIVALTEVAPEMKPEMLARVRFFETSSTTLPIAGSAIPGTSVFVPAGAFHDGDVWVITQFDGIEGVATKRSVRLTGSGDDDWKEVESGLMPGDLVVVSSDSPLESGQRVRVGQSGGI